MFDLSKLQIGRTTRKLEFFLHIIPRFLSTTPILVPEHQQVSQLILEQKSADQALQTFEWASKIPSFIHTQSTYRALVHKLCTFQRFEAVKQLLDEMPKRIGTPADDDIFITIVRGYGRARMTREVIGVLHMVTKFGNGNPSLKLLNSILDFLVKEDIDIAREFYRNKIMRTGMKGDDYTYGILMKGFCLTNRIGDGFKLLQVMKNHGLKVNPVVYNTLLYALCKNGKVGRARSLMNEMTEFSDVTFNILISAYCNENNLVQALVMLDKCFDNNFVPDVVALTKVVEILCNAERMSEAVELLEKFDEEKGKVDVVVYNTLIKGFIRAGKLNSGCGLLKKMEMKGCLPNTDTYNVLITGSCESGMFDSALELFHEMETVGLNRNFGTFETLIYGLCSCGRTDDGYKILDLMNKGSRRKYDNLGCYNSILYGLYKEDRLYEAVEFLNDMRKLFPIVVNRSLKILKCSQIGSLEEAKQALEKMSKEGTIPCAFVCASLIQGFCANALMKQAVELMNKMIGHGYFPNAYTFNALLRGFCSEGKVGAAVKLLDDMNLRGCIIDSESYGIIISDFCSHGEMEKAYVLFMQMVERGIAPDSCLWNVLIWVLLKRDSKHEYELLQSLINT